MQHQRFLLIDIGAGTMDMLYYDMSTQRHYKAVLMSPVRQLADQISQIPGDIVITGSEMGGGSLSDVLRQRVGQGYRVIMSQSAATTLHHHLDRVSSWGIEVVPDQQAQQYTREGVGHAIEIGDLQVERIAAVIETLGVPFEFEAVAICAQDHGVAPVGESHLDFRHHQFRARLNQTPSPAALLYAEDEIPSSMSRLNAIAHCARQLPTKEIFLMDSGMAAILGASMDPVLYGRQHVLLLDIATSHTVGAAMSDQLINGFFEYHTHAITRERIEELLVALADGKVSHADILSQGGHGAYLRTAGGFSAIQAIVATGPKRGLMKGSKLTITWGAPLGDNMMTGTVGLLEALRQRKGLAPILYV